MWTTIYRIAVKYFRNLKQFQLNTFTSLCCKLSTGFQKFRLQRFVMQQNIEYGELKQMTICNNYSYKLFEMQLRRQNLFTLPYFDSSYFLFFWKQTVQSKILGPDPTVATCADLSAPRVARNLQYVIKNYESK